MRDGRVSFWDLYYFYSLIVPLLLVIMNEMYFFYYRYTAAVVLELDFDRIDINQCPVSLGNDKPNRFADTARCKNETTEVKFFDYWTYSEFQYSKSYQFRDRIRHTLDWHNFHTRSNLYCLNTDASQTYFIWVVLSISIDLQWNISDTIHWNIWVAYWWHENRKAFLSSF